MSEEEARDDIIDIIHNEGPVKEKEIEPIIEEEVKPKPKPKSSRVRAKPKIKIVKESVEPIIEEEPIVEEPIVVEEKQHQ